MSLNGCTVRTLEMAESVEPRTSHEIKRTAARQLLALFRTTRPLPSLVAGTLSASVVFAAQGHFSIVGVAAGFAMNTLTMFGFVINDVVDFDKDASASVRRPIATGELSRSSALLLAAALLLFVYLAAPARGFGGKCWR